MFLSLCFFGILKGLVGQKLGATTRGSRASNIIGAPKKSDVGPTLDGSCWLSWGDSEMNYGINFVG